MALFEATKSILGIKSQVQFVQIWPGVDPDASTT